MKFFKRTNTDTAAIPEDLQPYYSSQNSGLRSWIGPILRVVLLLALLALLIWGGLWLFNTLSNRSDDKQTASTNSSQAAQTADQKQKAAQQAADQKAAEQKAAEKKAADQRAADQKKAADQKAANEKAGAGTPPATTTPAPAPAAAPTPAPAATAPAAPAPTAAQGTPTTPAPAAAAPSSPDTLANSGPGEAIALFAAVATVAGLLHRFYLLRTLR